jgi:hypothetical protein
MKPLELNSPVRVATKVSDTVMLAVLGSMVNFSVAMGSNIAAMALVQLLAKYGT